MKNIYKGFSSKNFQKNKSFVLTDVELVKRDLLNNIFTRRAERIKMSTFGTRIQDLLFDQMDDRLLQIIKEDFETVFKYDPRVDLISLNVIPMTEEHSILILVDLKYVELNLYDRMDITIDTSA